MVLERLIKIELANNRTARGKPKLFLVPKQVLLQVLVKVYIILHEIIHGADNGEVGAWLCFLWGRAFPVLAHSQ